MAVDLFSGTGSKMFVSSVAIAASTDTKAEYEAVTWLEIGGVVSIPGLGQTADQKTIELLSENRVVKKKGVFNGGDGTILCGKDTKDLGQKKLYEALLSPNDYGFKIQRNDAGAGSPSSDSLRYFRGQILSGADNEITGEIIQVSFSVSVNSDFVDVDAV